MVAPMRGDMVAAAATLLLVALAALSGAQLAAAGGLEDVVPAPGHLITPPPELPANLRKATPRAVHTQCGTVTPPETKIASAESSRLAVEASRVNQRSSGLARKKIRVVFHIIYTSFYSELFDQTFYTGYVSKTQLTAQVKLLNDAFAGRRGSKVDTNTKFYWNSKTDWWIYDVTNVTTGDFFNIVPNNQESLLFKQTFRKGNSVTLNVYTATLLLPDQPGVNLLGYATFPWDYKKMALYDGVYMNYDAMTGGEFTDFAEGVTLAHEVGHWAGLFHTFQGGCSADPRKGDKVADTVPEATSASGCPKNRKTCKGKGYNAKWRDPVNNIMDYTTDKCRTTLTRGQATRADSAWATWRGCKACLKINGEAPPTAART